MKNNIRNIKYVLFLCLMVGFSSCQDDFLEITPKGRIISKTVSDYNLTLNNLSLVNVINAFGVGAAQVPMGDEIAAFDPYFSGVAARHQRLFRWEDIVYEPDENAVEMSMTMQSIYIYNAIINGVMDATDGTELTKKSLQAEALAGRAWTYFLLINYYGLPYSESTASTAAGFPIVKDADVTLTGFSRASVKEVYDFIIEDLTTAIPNLPQQTSSRLRMSRSAAEGLLGKVYVFMGRYSDAITHLNSSIEGIATSSNPTRLYDYNVTFGTGGAFMPIGMFGPAFPTLPNNQEIVYAKQFSNNWAFFDNEIILKPSTVTLYGASDLRRNFYSTSAFYGGPYPNGMLRRVGPAAVQFGVVVPELYLLKAECEARLNQLPAAVADVEALRRKRMPVVDAAVSSSVAGNQEALVKFILEERIREFAVQGYRWFDMRRLSVDPVYNQTVTYTHTLFDATGNVLENYQLRPERFALRFPQKVMDQNPGMTNN
jgi:hypothetical protein